MVSGKGMDTARAAQAWGLLVDGHRVDYGGGTRRIYPSHAQVAREVGLPASTVTRWAARTGVAKARAEVMAGDLVPGQVDATTEALMAAIASNAEACMRAGRPLSERERERLGRLIEWAATHRVLTTATIGRVRTLLACMPVKAGRRRRRP